MFDYVYICSGLLVTELKCDGFIMTVIAAYMQYDEKKEALINAIFIGLFNVFKNGTSHEMTRWDDCGISLNHEETERKPSILLYAYDTILLPASEKLVRMLSRSYNECSSMMFKVYPSKSNSIISERDRQCQCNISFHGAKL